MIGIFDSGVGGLSVLAAIAAILPHEEILYFADLAHFPYGDKSRAEILRHCTQIAAFLFSQGVEILVIGCHTASALAKQPLSQLFPLPIIGMVEPTLRTTLKGKITLLATEATIQSHVYQNAIPNLSCISCPDLARKLQESNPDIQSTIQSCIRPLLGKQIDTLILGCTHFAFALHEIEEELDTTTQVINPALAVAQEVKRQIKHPKPKSYSAQHTLYASGKFDTFRSFVDRHPPTAPYTILRADF